MGVEAVDERCVFLASAVFDGHNVVKLLRTGEVGQHVVLHATCQVVEVAVGRTLLPVVVAKLIYKRHVVLAYAVEHCQQVLLARRPPYNVAREHHEVGFLLRDDVVDHLQRSL